MKNAIRPSFFPSSGILKGMGSSYAKNVAKDMTNVFVKVINTSNQTCQSHNVQSNVIDICGNSSGGNEDFTTNQSNSVQTSISCVQNNQFSTQLSTAISDATQQVTNATTHAFGFGSATSKNISDDIETLANIVKNQYFQSCVNLNSQFNGLKVCKNSPQGNLIVNASQNNFETATINCIQQDSAVTGIQTQITNDLSQRATATVEGLLGPLVFIVILIIVIFGAIILGGAHVFSSPVFLIFLVVFIGAYLVIAGVKGWFPFNT